METLNYEELIDELCIPTIKILRENLNVETLFCCQGSSVPGDDHSKTGYISAILNDNAEKVFIELAKSLGQAENELPHDVCSIQYRYRYGPKIILRLKRLQDRNLLEKTWKYIETILKKRY